MMTRPTQRTNAFTVHSRRNGNGEFECRFHVELLCVGNALPVIRCRILAFDIRRRPSQGYQHTCAMLYKKMSVYFSCKEKLILLLLKKDVIQNYNESCLNVFCHLLAEKYKYMVSQRPGRGRSIDYKVIFLLHSANRKKPFLIFYWDIGEEMQSEERVARKREVMTNLNTTIFTEILHTRLGYANKSTKFSKCIHTFQLRV